MKQLLKLSLLLLAFLLPATAHAYNFEVDGIYYNIKGKEAIVTYKEYSGGGISTDYSGDIIIPANVTYKGTTYSVTSIGREAFLGCNGLTSIIIPNSITCIDYEAFSGCIGLTNLTISNSVTTIKGYAFYNCSALTSISIPNSVTTIGTHAFEGTAWYNNQPDGLVYAGLVAYKYKGDMSSDTIITLRDGTLGIADDAFRARPYVTSINIPNSVTYIGVAAFCDCTGLTYVDIPNSVTTIDSEAFWCCTNLSSINLPESVSRIGSYAFDSTPWYNNKPNGVVYAGTVLYKYKGTMSSYTSISITDGTISIANGAFQNCNYLKSITIPNSVTYIGSSAFSGCTRLSGELILPNALTAIGGAAFYNCIGLTSVHIPNTVTSIGDMAFYKCTGLQSITIPNSVTTIDDGAFESCSGLTGELIIPNSLTHIGSSAFSNCKRLSGELNLPCSIISIGNGAFAGCSGLTSISIPNSVTTIGEQAFNGCSGLTGELNIPNSVTSIGEFAFYFCSGLTGELYIPNSLSSIGRAVFSGCSGLTSVNIPNSVNSIGESAFYNCSGLTGELIIPNSVTSIGSYAFYNCTGLTSVNIPNSVNSIGGSVFYNCSGLTGELNIPNSVTSIGSYAFYNCSGLTGNLTLPNSITAIGGYAFSGCTGLTGELVIPNSVTTIGASAFFGCSGFTSVTISDSVTTIGSQAFVNCPVIESVTCNATTPPVCDGNMFNTNVYIHTPLYVPLGTEKLYMYDQSWGQFINVIGIKTQDDVMATEITLDQSVMSMILGTSSQLVATVLPDSTTNKAVAWASSNPNVATVNEDGVVTAMGLGNALITAVTTDGSNLSATCRVIVTSMSTSNGFAVADVEVMHGKEIVIPVAMKNDQTILAFQTDICLPEGFSIVMDEDDEYMISPSNRLTDDHILMANEGNGAVSVVCYTPEGRPIAGNSGDDLFYITIQVPEDASGDYAIYLRNSRLTTADYTELRVPDAGAVITVKSFIPGDANDSRTVTVTDIVVTAQYILGRNPDPFIFEAADMNSDGDVTVTDIMLIAYLINHPVMDAPKRMPALDSGLDRMSGDGVTLMAGETRTVSIVLDNETDYTAFQMDLTLPEGLTASNFQLTDRAGGHAFEVNAIGGDKLRALCYSPTIEAIGGHSGALLTFDVTATSNVDGSIIVDGIELVTTGCQTVLMNGFAIGVNSLTSVNEVVSGKTVAAVEYYNLAGQQIDRPQGGVTLVVTTYTDGTRSTTKVIK